MSEQLATHPLPPLSRVTRRPAAPPRGRCPPAGCSPQTRWRRPGRYVVRGCRGGEPAHRLKLQPKVKVCVKVGGSVVVKVARIPYRILPYAARQTARSCRTCSAIALRPPPAVRSTSSRLALERARCASIADAKPSMSTCRVGGGVCVSTWGTQLKLKVRTLRVHCRRKALHVDLCVHARVFVWRVLLLANIG